MMEFKRHHIQRFKRLFGGKRASSFVLTAAIGMGVVFSEISPNKINAFETQQVRGHRSVEQVITTDKICVGCGESKPTSEFASKGRGRLSRFCKVCDNQKRRSSYTPRRSTSQWEPKIIFEATGTDKVAPLIFDIMLEQHFIESPEKDEGGDFDLLASIRRPSVIDEIT